MFVYFVVGDLLFDCGREELSPFSSEELSASPVDYLGERASVWLKILREEQNRKRMDYHESLVEFRVGL